MTFHMVPFAILFHCHFDAQFLKDGYILCYSSPLLLKAKKATLRNYLLLHLEILFLLM